MRRIALVVLLAACAGRAPADPASERVQKLVAEQPANTVYRDVLATYFLANLAEKDAERTVLKIAL